MASLSIIETETIKSINGPRIIYYGRLPALKIPPTTPIFGEKTQAKIGEFASPSESPKKFDLSTMKSLFVDVIVKNAVSPLNFKIQNYRQSANLQTLESGMTTFYAAGTQSKPLTFQDLKLHGHYAAKYFMDAPTSTDADAKEEHWVRCQIMKPFKANMPILTYLIDHGIYHATEPRNIQPLKKTFLDLPVQSYEAKLHFVEASQHQFTPEDCLRFQKRVEGKSFCGVIVPNSGQNSKEEEELRIILIDTSKDKDEYIHSLFISKKLKKIK